MRKFQPSVRRPASLAVALLAAAPFGALVGCYDAEFDELASGLYACTADADCNTGFRCIDTICIDDQGPALEITGPELLQILPAGSTAFPLVIRGSGLTLAEPTGSSTDGTGYLEVTVDGIARLTIENSQAIVAGSLEDGIELPMVPLESNSGAHRVEVTAFRSDGTEYENPSSIARRLFFVNDADENPKIGITAPWPGEKLRLSETLQVDVAAINVTWTDAGSGKTEGRGHTHVYVNNDNYPGCLPACNLNYSGAYGPSLNGTNDSRVLSDVLELSSSSVRTGEGTVAAGLQWDDHVPYPATSNDPDEFDMFRDQLVNDALTYIFEE